MLYGGSNPDFSLLLTKLAALRVVDNLVYGSEASEQIFSLVDKFLTVLVADEFSSSQQRALLYIFYHGSAATGWSGTEFD
jgi:hypothetical protein